MLLCLHPLCVVLCREGGLSGTAPNSGNTAISEVSAEEQHEKDMALQAAREKHGAFLFGCESKLSQGSRIYPILALLCLLTLSVSLLYMAYCTCTEAYVAFLRELSSVMAAQLLEALVLKVRFSEWGALLLYQEVGITILTAVYSATSLLYLLCTYC